MGQDIEKNKKHFSQQRFVYVMNVDKMICIFEFTKPIFIKLSMYVKVKENYSRKQLNWDQIIISKWRPFYNYVKSGGKMAKIESNY